MEELCSDNKQITNKNIISEPCGREQLGAALGSDLEKPLGGGGVELRPGFDGSGDRPREGMTPKAVQAVSQGAGSESVPQLLGLAVPYTDLDLSFC